MQTYVFFFLRLTFLSVLLLSLPIADAYAQTEPNETLRLSELINETLKNNPDIIAARKRWESAQAIIEARRALPDPQFSYTYFVESVETRVGPQKQALGVKQTFPFFGKRGLRADVAAKEAEALKESYEALKSEVIRQVKRTFYDLFYVSTIIDITQSEKWLLRRFEKIASAKYQTGEGSQQSILKVQVEISKLDDRLLALGNRRQTAEAQLNALVNQPPDRALKRPEQPKFKELLFQQQELFQLAKENRPELSVAKALIEKSEGSYELAKKEYYPDLTIGANYIEVDNGPLNVKDNGQDAFNISFGINIPIWRRKLSSQAKSAFEMIQVQNRRYQNIMNQTLFQVKDNYFKIQTARETVDLYKNVLIPQAQQSLKSAEAGYVTGIVSFLDLLDAQRILLQIQFGYWQAYTDYLRRVADLERAVGIELVEHLPKKEDSAKEK
jgi:outer membrane protein TolC